MARDGLGVYELPAGNPVVTGTTISSTVHNNTMADIAAALTQSASSDGQKTYTNNQPMGGFKHLDVGPATLPNQYATASQVQGNTLHLLGSVAGTNTITASFSPGIVPVSYANGQSFSFTPVNTNTGATTINISSLGAANVYHNGSPCLGGEIRANIPCTIYYDGTRFNLISPYVGGIIPGTVIIGDPTSNLASYNPFNTPLIWIQGNIQQEIRVNSYHNDAANSTNIVLMKSRGTAASPLDVQNGDQIAGIIPYANSGNIGWHTGHIFSVIDGAVTTGQQPPSRWEIYASALNTPPNLVFTAKSAGTQTTGYSTVTGSIGAGTTTPNPVGYGTAITASSATFSALSAQSSAVDASGTIVGDFTFNATANTSAPDTRIAYIRATTSGATPNWRGGKLELFTRADGGGGSVGLAITSSSDVQFPNIGTTASAANAFLDNASSNTILRSTSRAEFKSDIENIDVDIIKKVLSSFRAVWFRSTCEADRKDWSYYGAISDELAKIDPRLVFWTKKIIGYDDQEYEEDVEVMEECDLEEISIEGDKAVMRITKGFRQKYNEYPLFDESGNPVMSGDIHQTFKKPCIEKVKKIRKVPIYGDPIPDGVQYDRLGVFALAALQLKEKGLL